ARLPRNGRSERGAPERGRDLPDLGLSDRRQVDRTPLRGSTPSPGRRERRAPCGANSPSHLVRGAVAGSSAILPRMSHRARRACGGAAAMALAALTLRAGAQQIPGPSPGAAAALARGEWPTYAGTYASAKYSPLDQINAGNVASLAIAWRWISADRA